MSLPEIVLSRAQPVSLVPIRKLLTEPSEWWS